MYNHDEFLISCIDEQVTVGGDICLTGILTAFDKKKLCVFLTRRLKNGDTQVTMVYLEDINNVVKTIKGDN